MVLPRLTIDLDRIEHNARHIVEFCRAHGIDVCGVTKVACGHPEVARAMLRGGVGMLGDSRLENIRRLRAAGIDIPMMLLRVPALSAADAVVETVDLSLNSELAVLEALSNAALRRDRIHGVIIMVDLGDLREGVWPDDLNRLVKTASGLPGIRIEGLGTNLACFGGVVPSENNMGRLVELAAGVERILGRGLERISGINSSGLEMIAACKMPARVNHARIGEAILLGRETTRRKPWPGTCQDAFLIYAEVLEVNRKPSRPMGERGEDAFGGLAQFEERGDELRALLNLGRQDVDITAITPCEPGAVILGASSDYLVVDISTVGKTIRVGDELAFSPNYSALLTAMTSNYVEKIVLGERANGSANNHEDGNRLR